MLMVRSPEVVMAVPESVTEMPVPCRSFTEVTVPAFLVNPQPDTVDSVGMAEESA